MNNDYAQPTRRDLIVKAGLLTLSGAVAMSLAVAQQSDLRASLGKDSTVQEPVSLRSSPQ